MHFKMRQSVYPAIFFLTFFTEETKKDVLKDKNLTIFLGLVFRFYYEFPDTAYCSRAEPFLQKLM